MMVMGSAALSLDVFAWPPPETRTRFVTFAGAFVATLTVTMIAGKLAPEASASERVQVKFVILKDQPEPLIAVAVRPSGRESVTVIVPEEALGPTFTTVIVHVSPRSPWVKFP